MMPFMVWSPDLGETVEDAREYQAIDVVAAARGAAEYDHAHGGGSEWTWPITYHVQAGAGAPVYSVEVSRELVPEFWAERPKLV